MVTPRRVEGKKQSFVFGAAKGLFCLALGGSGAQVREVQRSAGLCSGTRREETLVEGTRVRVCSGGPGRAACSCAVDFLFICLFSSSSEYSVALCFFFFFFFPQ